MNMKIQEIINNTSKIYAFGGLITQDNLLEYFKNEDSVQTTLTNQGRRKLELGELEGKFIAVLPGIGLADCFP